MARGASRAMEGEVMVVPMQLDSDQWQADLDHLVEGLHRTHRNLFHTTSPEAFDRAVRFLRGRLPTLAWHEVVVEFARLVASIGDGHTVLRLTEVPGFRRYPAVFHHVSDGLHVRAIASEHADVAGARLIAVGDTPIDEVYAILRPLVSRDNEMGVLAGVPPLLAIPEVMHACGLAADPDKVTFTLQRRDGTATSVALSAVPSMPGGLVDARDATTAPTPHWLQRSAEENWFGRVDGTDALYVAYNRVRDSDGEPLSVFFDRLFETIEGEGIERLILDIRLNHGGNNLLNQALIHHLVRCDRVNRWGGLFAIIGRHTFSAAMNLAVDLERHTRVLFVGEPTGSSPNHYGENGTVVFPHSRLRVSVSMLWWQVSIPHDDRPWILPDLPARLGSGDYAANHDPAVDAALRDEGGATEPLPYPDRLFAQLQRSHPRPVTTAPGAAPRPADDAHA